MRKLFISADMEGCAAVASPDALSPSRWEWVAARRWMTMEVVAIARAALDRGYDEVIVSDGHGSAQNIDPDLLPDDVRLVRSWPRPLLQMQGIEDPAVEACAFVGYHAAAEQSDSILAHTYHSAVFRSVRLNGVSCSEGYLNAALAGEFGKPVIFVSGDQHTAQDALRYAPDAATFIAKDSLGVRSQSSLPPSQVCRQLGESFAKALDNPALVPFRIEGPYVLEVETVLKVTAEVLSYLPTVRRNGGYGVRVEFSSISELMKFVAAAMLYSPTGKN